jgi:hypothetical protein
MDAFHVKLRCPNSDCQLPLRAVISGSSRDLTCPKCSERVFRVRPVTGVVYVMSNPHHSGLVKIGMTAKSAARRADALSGTGTVGKWQVDAVFCSSNAKRDERRVHRRLALDHFEKDYFRLSSPMAVNRIRSALGRDPFHVNPTIRNEYERIREYNRPLAMKCFGTPQRDMQVGQLSFNI